MAHDILIRLAIAYTLVGAFIFTVVITCASLVGWVKFANPGHQNKLFYMLIVQLVTIAVTMFGNILDYDTGEAASKVTTASIQKTPEDALQALAKNAVMGTDNIDPADVEIVLKYGKLPEAIAIFTKPDSADVKRRQFATYLVRHDKLGAAYTVSTHISNKAEIKNVAIPVVDRTLPLADESSGEWKFLCNVYGLLSNPQRGVLLQRMRDRALSLRCRWNQHDP